MKQQTGYKVRVIGPSGRAGYVAKNDGAGTWDGAWYTHNEIDQIKIWKTQRGAQRWINERPCVAMYMTPVVEEEEAR